MLNLSVSLDVLSELEIELKQPRIITLVADGEAKSEIIAEGKLENGVYSEAEFSYYKNLTVEASDEMYGKSILVKGTWNGAPFVCCTDEENEVEIDFEDEGITVEGSQEINVIFHVNRLVSEIDFSLAVDGNADGVIEIGPEGVDKSEEHTSELQSLMRISYAVLCLKK